MSFKWIGGALLLVAVTFGGAEEARAQACGDIDAEEVYEFLLDELDGVFPLPANECTKITKGAVAACQKAVSAAASCYESLYANAYKGHKTACGADDDPAACTDFYKGELEEIRAEIQAVAEFEHESCEEFAGAFNEICVTGPI
jgi:hypothetical protein